MLVEPSELPHIRKWVSKPQGPRPDLDLVAKWLKQCRESHGKCWEKEDRIPPTRLLEIISGPKSGQYDLKLLENPSP